MNKKEFGKAVHAILNTIINKYCVCGEKSIEHIIDMFNVANDMIRMYNLKESECIEIYHLTLNKMLKGDNSKFRIVYEGCTYKLVMVISS